ncbi:U-reduvitoxin-Pr11a-like [Mya arenaria]|uniref:U-reduvitoxin-Pr11a-like n=1 Tax=Mya arenaria TaxID=6604 RepID=UPI0022E8DD80|nr:U-reduvitoxin-Pr11a-like [Mya arenaria]
MLMILALFVVSVGVMGQDCDYAGTLHKTGESFPSTDGCNNCFCSNGAVACTLKFCLPINNGNCTYGGASYQAGESFKAQDGCNTCSCNSFGRVMCTEMACLPLVTPPP